jgi:HD-like signal output (HDOD) protein
MKQLEAKETDTVVLESDYHEARATTAALVEDLERTLSSGKLELPSLPEVALKIRRALADDTVSVSEIARLIGADPALAARIVRVANSAMFYRGSRPITSVNAAVSQLGYKMVRNVALSFAAQQVFIGYGSRPLRELVAAIWLHSLHTAVLAHMIARSRTALNPDEAFLAGLLHEVGKLYILLRAKDAPAACANEPAFVSVLSSWHPRMGRAVIDAWELSEELASAVGDHEQCSLIIADPPTLTGVVAVANFFAERSSAASADADFHAKLPDLGALALDKTTFDWLIRAADVDVRLLMIAFGA